MPSKMCPHCRVEKDNREFYKNRSRKDGYNSFCKLCHGTYCKEWRQSKKGKERIQKYEEEYRRSGRRRDVVDRYSKTDKNRARIRRFQRSPKGRECILRGVHKRSAKIKLSICDLTAGQWAEQC